MAAGFALAAALAAVAFAAKGGTELGRTSLTEVFLTIGGGIACAIGILFATRSRPHGAITVALFVALTLLTALSIEWSIVPGDSWIEANRTLAYLAVFVGAVALGNLGPGGAELVLRALLAAATVVVGYALVSRVWPGDLAELEIYARIGQPFGYWNAVGVTAAFALPLTLALGARRTVTPAASALAYPVAGLMIVALFLTYSRSALLGAVVVVVLWLVFVPLRLQERRRPDHRRRSARPRYCCGRRARRRSRRTASRSPFARTSRPSSGSCCWCWSWRCTRSGYAFTSSRERMLIEPAARRAIGQLLVGAVVVAALAVVGAVALSDRGLGGTVSDRWEELTDDSATTDAGPSRLAATSSSRSRYWRQAIDVFEEKPVAGRRRGRVRHGRTPLP